MSKSNAPSPHHPKLHRGPKIRTSCPNPGGDLYVKDEVLANCAPIDISTYIARLDLVDMQLGSSVMMNAKALAAGLDVAPRELLHMAIARLGKPTSKRADYCLDAVLTMTMWSIRSDIFRSRSRAQSRRETIPFDFVDEQLSDTRSIVDPYLTITRRGDRASFERLLDAFGGTANQLTGSIIVKSRRVAANRVTRRSKANSLL